MKMLWKYLNEQKPRYKYVSFFTDCDQSTLACVQILKNPQKVDSIFSEKNLQPQDLFFFVQYEVTVGSDVMLPIAGDTRQDCRLSAEEQLQVTYYLFGSWILKWLCLIAIFPIWLEYSVFLSLVWTLIIVPIT